MIYDFSNFIKNLFNPIEVQFPPITTILSSTIKCNKCGHYYKVNSPVGFNNYPNLCPNCGSRN